MERISNRQEYLDYLQADAMAMGIDFHSRKERIRSHYANPRWKFLKLLRAVEYCKNTDRNLFTHLRYLIFWYRYKKLGLKLGFTIPPNVCGPGLSLPHYGTIVISKRASIGAHCRIHVCVNIGESADGAPQIGHHVYIGPGAKLFGNIVIGNHCQIGANAVVNKSFPEDHQLIAGIPATGRARTTS